MTLRLRIASFSYSDPPIVRLICQQNDSHYSLEEPLVELSRGGAVEMGRGGECVFMQLSQL
jgi:hypothetical protein